MTRADGVNSGPVNQGSSFPVFAPVMEVATQGVASTSQRMVISGYRKAILICPVVPIAKISNPWNNEFVFVKIVIHYRHHNINFRKIFS